MSTYPYYRGVHHQTLCAIRRRMKAGMRMEFAAADFGLSLREAKLAMLALRDEKRRQRVRALEEMLAKRRVGCQTES